MLSSRHCPVIKPAGRICQDLVSITTASTGTAATNVDGSTVHYALNINPTVAYESKHCSLSDKRKQSLRNKFEHLQAVMVDEVSSFHMPFAKE